MLPSLVPLYVVHKAGEIGAPLGPGFNFWKLARVKVLHVLLQLQSHLWRRRNMEACALHVKSLHGNLIWSFEFVMWCRPAGEKIYSFTRSIPLNASNIFAFLLKV